MRPISLYFEPEPLPGTVRMSSTPESIVVIVVSLGNGTGERVELSIAQFNAMMVRSKKFERVTWGQPYANRLVPHEYR